MERIPQHTYRVTFGGTEFTRTTWSVYTHAAHSGDRFRGTVTFHKSEAAARRRAGVSGMVKPLTQPAGAGACIVCNGARVITERTATRGMVTSSCWKCN
jgi:hypothetical protein